MAIATFFQAVTVGPVHVRPDGVGPIEELKEVLAAFAALEDGLEEPGGHALQILGRCGIGLLESLKR